MTTHIIKDMSQLVTHFPPAPDLLDLIKNTLPGQDGVAILYSLLGSLELRIARLAGITANAIVSDVRSEESCLDSYNDLMYSLRGAELAAEWFDKAGGTHRGELCKDLTQLIGFHHLVYDHTSSVVGGKNMRVVNWLDSIERAAEPRPVEQWKLDHMWAIYVEECNGDPTMTRSEYDLLCTRELTGNKAAWAKHAASIENIITAADEDKHVDFGLLSVQTQHALLTSYATPERLSRLRSSIMKRARSAFEFDASFRLHRAFVDACKFALTHRRYANINQDQPAVQPAPTTSADIAAATRVRQEGGVHADLVQESKDAAKRAELAAKLELTNSD